jgi:hypothetical protein
LHPSPSKAEETEFDPMHYSKIPQGLKLNGHILVLERYMLPKSYEGLHLHILLLCSVPFVEYQGHSKVKLVYSLQLLYKTFEYTLKLSLSFAQAHHQNRGRQFALKLA